MKDVRRGGITASYPYLRPNVQLPPNPHQFSPMFPGVNVNSRNCPTYVNSYVRPNFEPPLTCANQTPFPPTYVSISDINHPCHPIYTMPHIQPSFTCASASTSHIASPYFFSPTFTRTPHRTPLPPYAVNPTPVLTPFYASNNPGSFTSQPPVFINPSSRKRRYPHNSSVTPSVTSVTGSSSSLRPLINVNTSYVSPALLPPTGSSTSHVNSSVLPPITCSTISHVNPSSSVTQANTNTDLPSSPEVLIIEEISRANPVLPPVTSSSTSCINSPLPPITCSSTPLYSRINISCSIVNPSSSSSSR